MLEGEPMDTAYASRRLHTALLNEQERMRILIFTPLGKGGQGGVDRMMDGLGEEIARQKPAGVDVDFIATRGQSSLWLPVFILTVMKSVFFGVTHSYDLWHINLGSFGSTIRKLIVVRIAQACRQPYVIHLHGGHFREYWEAQRPFYRNLIRGIFLRADGVVVLGHIWKDLILKHVPECADRITILPNATHVLSGVHSDRPGDQKVKILFLGRLGPEKGTPELLEALSNLPKEIEWECVLAGDGATEETRAFTDAKLPGRVAVLGWVDSASVQNLLRTSDILVLPSHVENLPMSVVEAFAHGVAVIATPVGSIPDILTHEKTGLLVRVRDVPALTSALERLILDTELRRTLGRNAKDLYNKSLTIDAYLKKLLMVWSHAKSVSQ
jgi:glycosyltransferase involved in cell wall biosynthesis